MDASLKNYLNSDEKVLSQLGPFFATDQRIIKYKRSSEGIGVNNKTFIDLSYSSITSIGIRTIEKSLRWLIGIGIFLIFIGLFIPNGLRESPGGVITTFLILLGIMLIIIGYLYRPRNEYFGFFGESIPEASGFSIGNNTKKNNIQSVWLIPAENIQYGDPSEFMKVVHKQLKKRGMREKRTIKSIEESQPNIQEVYKPNNEKVTDLEESSDENSVDVPTNKQNCDSNSEEEISETEKKIEKSTIQYCPYCGEENDGNYCSNCGEPMIGNIQNSKENFATYTDSYEKKARKINKSKSLIKTFNKKISTGSKKLRFLKFVGLGFVILFFMDLIFGYFMRIEIGYEIGYYGLIGLFWYQALLLTMYIIGGLTIGVIARGGIKYGIKVTFSVCAIFLIYSILEIIITSGKIPLWSNPIPYLISYGIFLSLFSLGAIVEGIIEEKYLL